MLLTPIITHTKHVIYVPSKRILTYCDKFKNRQKCYVLHILDVNRKSNDICNKINDFTYIDEWFIVIAASFRICAISNIRDGICIGLRGEMKRILKWDYFMTTWYNMKHQMFCLHTKGITSIKIKSDDKYEMEHVNIS